MGLKAHAPLLLWEILDDNVKFYHGGNSLPTADNILEILISVKKKSRLDIFREFSKNNPESMTAKMILLQDLRRIGGIRMSKANVDADNMLDAFDDSEIWGEYINTANSIFPQILARSDSVNIFDTFKIPFIKNSRLLQQFAIKHIDSTESALRDRPHSRELWELWSVFSPFLPDRSLASLMASLVSVPDLPGFPPVFLYPELIENYQSVEDWKQIIKLAEPV
jgi:hypothetical protein